MPYAGGRYGFFSISLIVLLLGLLSLHTPGANLTPDTLEDKSANFITNLDAGNLDAAYAAFDSTVRTKISVKRLKEIWGSLIEKAGRFIKINRFDRIEKDPYKIVIASCQFEKMQIGLQFTFDIHNYIAGFFIVPAFSENEFQSADYVNENKFSTEDVSIGKEPWILPGVLTIPFKGKPVPALVLIHGSGPQDRDETIGPNKPFRDLAEGLATNNIAVLRYDKRTRVYQQSVAEIKNTLTVQEEIIEDVFAAIEFLQHRKEVDPRRIFLLGHSLGGTMIPRIALKDSVCAGFVIMAGATRPLEDMIVEQAAYLAGLDSVLSDEEKKQIEKLQDQAARVKSQDLNINTPASLLPFSMDAAYWLDLRAYDPVMEAAKIKQPILVLQGSRDYQVTNEDLTGWRKALAYANNAEIINFPGLNHLFMRGTGISRPAEYMQKGHVAEEVIESIVNWIDGY